MAAKEMLQESTAKTDCRCRTIYFVVAVAVLLIFAAAILIWPTRYRYDTLKYGTFSYPVRTDRLTGVTQMLDMGGWETLESNFSTTKVPLSPAQLAKLGGDLKIEDTGRVTAEIYNGNEFHIGDIVVTISVKDAIGNEIMLRDYRLSSMWGEPLSSSQYTANLGFNLEPRHKFDWAIKSANRR